MWIGFLASFYISSEAAPLSHALEATQAPDTLRAAFVVELRSGQAFRIFAFDPRLPKDRRWRLEKEEGENAELDELGAAWGAEPAPDSRLFPDDLSLSMSASLEAEDMGHAWRIAFDHRPSVQRSEFDVWAARHLEASLWLDPEAGRFLRLDHNLPRPVTGPKGVRLLRYAQSHYLDCEPTFGLSFISAISVDLEARAGFRTIIRDYEMRVLSAEFFFASAADEAAFHKNRGNSTPSR
ncbi:MAG: hypothetical protein AAFR33_00090 [Pseudomonadota bacterium]